MTSRDSYLKRQYGISLNEYEQIFESQNGVCAICGKAWHKNLHVDHKHTRGEKKLPIQERKVLIRKNVRGLLCWNCNKAIGVFRDNVANLRNSASYLENWPAKKIIKESVGKNEV